MADSAEHSKKAKKKAETKAELLIKYGFIKEDKKKNYAQSEKDKNTLGEKDNRFFPVVGYELDKKDADEEEKEMVAYGEFFKTGYPKPLKSYRLTLEQYDLSLEEPYYWFLEYMKQNFSKIEKVEDSFAAAENSAFFGVTQQRLGAQQDRISQFLATIGKMIKELFQMVRELRIIKERLGYYRGVVEEIKKPLSDRERRDEITLKGVFIDLVQGGGKSAASVYGMATQLEFITLPDLFFDVPPFKDGKEMEKYIDSLEKDFNRNVIRVLKRHLAQYQSWRESTHKEHENREKFMLSYLRQHFEIVQMYVQWIKPYLHHVGKLGMKTSSLDSADIVSAFEGSLLDIEILARKEKNGANGCILLTFNYRTRPELKVVQEGYQRGPVHIGRLEVNSRVYAWTDEQIELYKKMKVEETFWLLGDVSLSIQTAMESLGEELFRYHREATGEGAEEKKEEEKPHKKKSFMEKMMGDFYVSGAKGKKAPSAKEEREKAEKLKSAMGSVVNTAKFHAFNSYNTFKKAHRMVAW